MNDRKHFRKDRRSDFDMTVLNMGEESQIPIPSRFKELYNSDRWEDYIFSRKPEDLHELMTDNELIKILRELNPKRKEALFYRGIWKYTASEIARSRGVSDRNIRKLYEAAVKEIHDKIIRND